MATCLMFIGVLREKEDKALPRERVFRDRSQVLNMLTDSELIGLYRFPRRVILYKASYQSNSYKISIS